MSSAPWGAATLASTAASKARSLLLSHAASALASLSDDYTAFQAQGGRGVFRSSDPTLSVTSAGNVSVEAFAQPGKGATLRTQLQTLGLANSSRHGGAVAGFFPIKSITRLSSLSALRFVEPTWAITNTGSVTSQGDSSVAADTARTTYGLTGSGVKVGILSDSFDTSTNSDHYANDVISGDLPAGVQVLSDYTDPTPTGTTADNPTDEGRAMAQTIYDTAPGASLAFATAFGGQSVMAANIRALRDAGSKVIVDDVEYLAEPMFQDGLVAQAVDDVVGSGVSYFSAAGNAGSQSYESAFQDGVNRAANSILSQNGAPAFAGGMTHDFDPGPGVDDMQAFTLGAGQSITLSFQWDQPYFSATGSGPGSASNLDLYVLNSAGTRVLAGAVTNNIGNDPIEVLGVRNSGTSAASLNLMIVNNSGPDPGLIKYVNFGSPVFTEYTGTTSTVFGHANAAGAAGVGAAAWYNTPAFGVSPAALDSYSSIGQTPVLFDKTGTRLATADVRQQPRFVAPDGGNTTFFGFDVGNDTDTLPNFFGTSAAAPAAAAVAALLLSGAPSLSPANVYSVMQNTALDMDNPNTAGFDVGPDAATGYGLIQADAALAAVFPRVQSVSINDGAAQRSEVTQATVTFTMPVTVDSNTFSIAGRAGAGPDTAVAFTNPSADQRTYLLTFSGSSVLNGSLSDGVYDLAVAAADVHAVGTPNAAMTLNFSSPLYRLYGDSNGDMTVNNADAFQFNKSYLKLTGQPGFLAFFDINADGMVNNADAFQFNKRYLVTLSF